MNTLLLQSMEQVTGTNERPRIAVSYVRVSTRRQAEKGGTEEGFSILFFSCFQIPFSIKLYLIFVPDVSALAYCIQSFRKMQVFYSRTFFSSSIKVLISLNSL